MNQVKIAIIINSFNRRELLKQALAALGGWIPDSEFAESCGVVVYEAGSTDGSLEWLYEIAPGLSFPLKVLIPSQGDDTSFSAGLNAGVAHAIEEYSALSHLLFYETDNQILSATPLRKSLDMLEMRGDLAACGYTVRRFDGSQAGVGTPFPSLLSFLLGNQLTSRLNLDPIPYSWTEPIPDVEFSEVDVVYTSPLLVKRSAWTDSGGLDAINFPFSDCDIDWATRLRKQNWRLGVIKTSDVIHDNLAAQSEWSKNRAIHFHRARLRYFSKYRRLSVYLVWPFPLMFRHLMEYIGACVVERDAVKRSRLKDQFKRLFIGAVRRYNP